jgi:hypothetical protein
MNYVYSITSDTANALLTIKDLRVEIGQSTIATSLDYISAQGDVLTIVFQSALSAADQTTLTAVVLAHQGNAIVDTAVPQLVSLSSDSNDSRDIPKVAIVESDDTFSTAVTHNFCDNTTWPATNDSVWTLGPTAGKTLLLSKAEVQFSHDVALNGTTSIYFDTYAYNPADLPNKILVDRKEYSSILSVLEIGNAHYTMPPVDGFTESMTTVQFNYVRAIPLKSSLGLEVRVSTDSNIEVGGTYVTVSFSTSEIDEL